MEFCGRGEGDKGGRFGVENEICCTMRSGGTSGNGWGRFCLPTQMRDDN